MAERRSFRAAAKELEERLHRAVNSRNGAQRAFNSAAETLNAANSTLYALQDAYDLVKPKPRVRKAKATKGGAA